MPDVTEREPIPRLPPIARRRKLREMFGVTQKQLAESAGVTERTVARWESGTDPTGPNLIKYAEILATWGERARQRR